MLHKVFIETMPVQRWILRVVRGAYCGDYPVEGWEELQRTLDLLRTDPDAAFSLDWLPSRDRGAESAAVR
ncbi:hypothetical protein [Catellatospora tritici]|uniref:hypothetical protein n=1 Tax=Catellatospora tritici TaxID=2851566 RepID=UPI001C2D7903|nr:hypothetical protein [Catellatospora tritici]MBV1851871.1 hypothetical protein [Catellatospora tritici]